MTALDAILLLLLVLFGFRGFWRGFLREAVGLAGLVAVFYVMVFTGWSEAFGGWLARRAGMSSEIAWGVAAVALALAIFFLVRLVGAGVVRATHAIFLRPVDRVAGVGLGLVEGTAALGLVMALWVRVAPTSGFSHWIEGSRVAQPMLQVAGRIVKAAGPYAAAVREAI
jgi:membrane protein required for colicin V production